MKVAVTNPDGSSQYGGWMRSLEVLDETTHDPHCSGCPICSPAARATMRTLSALDNEPPAPPDTIAAIRGRGNPFVPAPYAQDTSRVAAETFERAALRTGAEATEAPTINHEDFVRAVKRSRGLV